MDNSILLDELQNLGKQFAAVNRQIEDLRVEIRDMKSAGDRNVEALRQDTERKLDSLREESKSKLEALEASSTSAIQALKQDAESYRAETDRQRMEAEADIAFPSGGGPREIRLRSSGRSILGSGIQGQNQTSYRRFGD